MSQHLAERIEQVRRELRTDQCGCSGILCGGKSILDDPEFRAYVTLSMNTIAEYGVPYERAAEQLLGEADYYSLQARPSLYTQCMYAMAVAAFDAAQRAIR